MATLENAIEAALHVVNIPGMTLQEKLDMALAIEGGPDFDPADLELVSEQTLAALKRKQPSQSEQLIFVRNKIKEINVKLLDSYGKSSKNVLNYAVSQYVMRLILAKLDPNEPEPFPLALPQASKL